MAAFVQIVEFRTDRIDDLRALAEARDSLPSDGPMRRRTVTADRDHPGRYFTILEFDSYDSAMQVSASPEVSRFAAQMAALCDEPPIFHNLTVVDSWEAGPGGTFKAAVVAGAAAAAGVGAAAASAIKRRIAGSETEPEVVVEYAYTESSAMPEAVPTETVAQADDEVVSPSLDVKSTEDR